jgi:predicted dehydrogenase
MRALEAGKHVFVEKPLALTVNDAEALHAAAGARGLVLAVGHLLLHHPAIRCARQMVAKGLLGEPFEVTTNRATPGPPRKLGSAWWALAPHDVSLALHFFGELPIVVSATGGAWGRAQEDNAATAVLQFSGGRSARVHVARFAPDKRRDMSITGPQASLTFDELAAPDQALRLSAGPRAAVVVPVDPRDALLAQCREFVKSVAHGETAGGNGAHAVDVVRVLEAGERSMRAQGTPHALPAPSSPSVARPDPASSFEAA